MTMSSSAPAHYRPYHPKWYRQRVSVWWWLEKPVYALFVLRELTSVAVAFFALMLLALIRAVAAGPEAYARFQAKLQSPLFLVLDGIALALVLFHTVTWFNVAPKALVVRIGGRRVPDALVAGTHYAAWLGLSGVVAYVLLRG
jgi:fumarate reductase subunit C